MLLHSCAIICFCCTAAEGFSQDEEEEGLNEMKIALDEVSNGWLTTETADDRRKIKVENQETLSISDLSLGAQYFGMNLALYIFSPCDFAFQSHWNSDTLSYL